MTDPVSPSPVGRSLLAIGALHLVAAPWIVGPGLRGIAADRVVAAVECADPAERERRSHAFWYVVAGLGVLVCGAATARLERGEAGLPPATGAALLALAGGGGALVPASGFWAFALPGVLALRGRDVARGRGSSARRVAALDPALVETHHYADAFELLLDDDGDLTPEQWVRAGVDATPRWIKRIAGDAEGLASARAVESDGDVVVFAESDALMDTLLIGRNVAPGHRRLTTALRFHRPVLARALWTVVGVLHRRTARRVLTGGAAAFEVDGGARGARAGRRRR